MTSSFAASAAPTGRAAPPAVTELRTGQRLRRERIIAAAVQSMVAHEYERIQIKDVADRAEVALGTLYRYFVSKDHLFAEALVAWADGFGESITPSRGSAPRSGAPRTVRGATAAAEGSASDEAGASRASQQPVRTVDRVKALYHRAVRAFERQPNVYGVLLALQGVSEPNASAAFREFSRRQSVAFNSVLSRIPPERRADITHVMGAVLDQNLRQWRLGHQPIAAVYEAVDRAADLILRHRGAR